MNSAAQGDKALANSDCLSAIQHFTQALVELPRAPAYYIKRSTAYSRVKAADGGPNSSASLRDAEIALSLAQERGKRELILSAQMRRGVALYQLERFGDAGFVFDTIKGKTSASTEGKGKSEEVKDAMAGGAARSGGKNGYEQELPIWVAKVKGRLNKLGDGDEKAVVSVAEYPSGVRVPTEKDLKQQLEALKSGQMGSEGTPSQSVDQKPQTDKTATQEEPSAASAAPAAAPPAARVSDKVRHEWYQSHDSVVVTLYVKGIPKDRVDIELKGDSAALRFPLPSGTDYDFTVDPLFATIDPSASKVSVMSTKIEITLHKQTPGQKWNSLEASQADVKLADRQAATGSKPASDAGPSYPTSSRHGAKDWDKVASTLTAKKPNSKDQGKDKDKKKEAKKDGSKDDEAGDESDGAESADSDYGGGDPVDGFFKKLYASADPDTRRAMMKSYVESQGTSLSTNWGEVSQGKVEARPPSD